jgi:hypothetical protein
VLFEDELSVEIETRPDILYQSVSIKSNKYRHKLCSQDSQEQPQMEALGKFADIRDGNINPSLSIRDFIRFAEVTG